jgi:hypothetical protein
MSCQLIDPATLWLVGVGNRRAEMASFGCGALAFITSCPNLERELVVQRSQWLAVVMCLRWYHAMPTLATEPSMAMSWRVADASQDMMLRSDFVGWKYILLLV